MTIPTHAQVVIVGGGIAGCSTAYHLTKLGITDVLLLEQGKVTSGTTWQSRTWAKGDRGRLATME